MIKPIIKDILFLGQKSEDATKNDIAVIEDLTFLAEVLTFNVSKVGMNA